MDFTELIASFAERHGIADLAAEDNAAALDIDGIVVTLVAAGDAVSISADIGDPPAEGRADFAELLRLGLPNGIRAVIDIGGFFVFAAVLAECAPAAVAASTAAFAVNGIFQALPQGLSQAL